MSEGGDYVASSWDHGHDFSDARNSYERHAGRSYEAAQAEGRTHKDLCPLTISTQSSCPLILNIDQTGSMKDWPATIRSKGPFLAHEVKKEYLGEDAEISFGATGDARHTEDYPLQVRPFVKATNAAMKGPLEELVMEGKGGGC